MRPGRAALLPRRGNNLRANAASRNARLSSRTNKSMGIAGRLAKFFLHSQLTPLIALVALLLGLFAVLVTPREEEPQINVTMANVLIPFPGASARDVETLVATPAEQVLSQISGIEHVFSVSRPGMAVLTVQFKVGVPRTEALVRLYDTINSNRDWLPRELDMGEPIIKPKGIDDVPVVTLTLWSEDPQRGAYELERVAHAAEVELKRVPGTREVQTLGGPGRAVRVLLDSTSSMPAHLAIKTSPRRCWAPTPPCRPASWRPTTPRVEVADRQLSGERAGSEASWWWASAGPAGHLVGHGAHGRWAGAARQSMSGSAWARPHDGATGMDQRPNFPAVTLPSPRSRVKTPWRWPRQVTQRVAELRNTMVPGAWRSA